MLHPIVSQLFFENISSTASFDFERFFIFFIFDFFESRTKFADNAKLNEKQKRFFFQLKIDFSFTSVFNRSTLFRSIYRAKIGGGSATTVAFVNCIMVLYSNPSPPTLLREIRREGSIAMDFRRSSSATRFCTSRL